MKLILIIVPIFLCLNACSVLNKHRYVTTSEEVIYNSAWGKRTVEGADIESFESMLPGHAKDKNHAYYTWDVIDGADIATFEVINSETSRDAQFVYHKGKRCRSCNRDTYRELPHGWYLDKNAAYSSIIWRRIPIADFESFTVLNTWFAKDKNYVYRGDSVIAGADPATFKLASCGRSVVSGEDKNRCYWYRHAVPCDCEPHADPEFAPYYGVQFPGYGRLISLKSGGGNYVRVISVDGVLTDNEYRPIIAEGQRSLEIECKTADRVISRRAIMTVKGGVDYQKLPHAEETCDLKIADFAYVKGKLAFPELRIEDVPFIPDGRRNRNISGVLSAYFEPGKRKLELTCKEVNREEVVEASTMIELDLKPKHLYRLDASLDNGVCTAKLVSEENMDTIQMLPVGTTSHSNKSFQPTANASAELKR